MGVNQLPHFPGWKTSSFIQKLNTLMFGKQGSISLWCQLLAEAWLAEKNKSEYVSFQVRKLSMFDMPQGN